MAGSTSVGRLRFSPALLAPLLLILVPILQAYGETAAHWSSLIRPVGVAVLGAGIVTAALNGVLRRASLAAAASCVIVLVVVQQHDAALFFGGASATVLAYRQWQWSFRRRAVAVPPSLLLLPVGLMLVATVTRLVAFGVITLDDFVVSSPGTASAVGASESPSIYVLLLDGYPRGDTLEDELGINNDPFITALEERGFRVSRESRSTYQRTELSLASSMAGNPDALAKYDDDTDFERLIQYRREVRREWLNTSRLVAFRALGYRLVYVPSPVMHTDWSGWDERRDTGQVTDFEAMVLQRTALRALLGPWIADQQRDRVSESLEAWATAAGASGQQLVFAHVMAPHPPFLWGPGGGKVGPLQCWYSAECNLYHATAADLLISPQDYAARLRPQLEAVNRLVVEALDAIIAADPTAIIIVFSDHGARYEEPATDEWHRNLVAARRSQVGAVDGLFPALLDELDR